MRPLSGLLLSFFLPALLCAGEDAGFAKRFEEGKGKDAKKEKEEKKDSPGRCAPAGPCSPAVFMEVSTPT